MKALRKRAIAVTALSMTLGNLILIQSVTAQVTADHTVSTHVTTPDNLNFTVTNGRRAGNNLFHSFSEFSIPSNGSALFKNSTDVANIFSRVTGGNLSNIDGLIQANGNANLFLLNPNGIIFGPNARLDIGGSFLASTADTLLFDENKIFSATEINASQLLSVNVPIGLQWNQAPPAPITSRGNTLAVPRGESLTLLGGDLNLNESTLTTLGGQISLGSLGTVGTVQLIGRQSVNFPDRLARGDVILEKASLVQAESGHIDVIANALSLTGGSRFETVTHSPRAGGDITVNASGAINIEGFSEDGLFSGILSSSATGMSGTGGNITLNSPQNTLTLAERGFIGTLTHSQNAGGNVEVNVNRLNLNAGGQIVTLTSNRGDGGTITLNAKEEINLAGGSDNFIDHPFLALSTFDLNSLDFSTEPNPNVSQSGPGGIPYVSIERKPTQIISGSTLLGSPSDQVEYYSFGVVEGDSRAIFDLDFSGSDTQIFLFSQTTGDLIGENDDAFEDVGVGGSLTPLDPFLDLTLSEPGFYILGVANFPASGVSQELVRGNGVPISESYTLQVSIENQGTEGIVFAPPNPNSSRNPNVSEVSGVFAESSGRGKAGQLILNTEQLTLSDNSKLSTTTSGLGPGGDIHIDTGQLSLLGSDILTQTLAAGNAGDIRIRARNTIQLNTISGTREGDFAGSRIRSEHEEFQSLGSSGEIEIETSILSLENRSLISNSGAGQTGSGRSDLNITAFESITLSNSDIGSLNLTEGSAGGSITINTKELQVLDGIIVQLALGDANNTLLITAQDSIEVIGEESVILVGPQRGSSNGSGLILRTGDLKIADGATVGLNDFSRTDAETSATVTIEANSISLSNQARLLSVPDAPTVPGSDALPSFNGGAGTLNITATEDVFVVGDSQISVSSSVSGKDAGNLTLSARSLLVDQGGLISAESNGGDQGNIDLTLDDLLLLRRGGSITTNATGTSTGGNISIRSPFILAFPNENSDIIANAKEGDGGNISLTTQSLIGLVLTNNNNPRNNTISEITASSQLGVDGELLLRSPSTDPRDKIAVLPENILDASQQVVSHCGTGEGRFVVTGRSGLPAQPKNLATRDQPWTDIRDLSAFQQLSSVTPSSPVGEPPPLTEANALQVNAAGQINLVASQSSPRPMKKQCDLYSP